MKKFLSLVSVLMIVAMFASCSDDDRVGESAMGYVRLSLNTITSTNTRALDRTTYNPKQFAVSITNASGDVVEHTDDFTQWSDKEIALPAGTYTVTASSNGFDGNESGFDIPYYSGSSQFTVGEKTSQTVSVTCTLATVKVTVKFSDRFKSVFSAANVKVSSAKEGITPLDFTLSADYNDGVAGYFPVGDITALVSVTSDKGQFSSSKTLENVKARDHYILCYDVAEHGTGSISVVASVNGNTYTYNVDVNDFGKVIVDADDLSEKSAKAGQVWSNKATLSGVISGIASYDVANVKFEYKADGDAEYTSVAAVESGNDDVAHIVQAAISNMVPETSYSYRVVYDDGTDQYSSKEMTFKTESCTPLFNGNMDDWYKRSGAFLSRQAQWYACSESYYNANGTWWDSSNRGTTEGAGYLANKNPTTGESTIVHTAGGKSACLASTSAVGVFAAASLYAGTFNSLNGTSGAKLDWGRPFTSRPKALSGWYQYSPGTIDYVGSNTPQSAGVVKGQTTDMCSAYIALVHVTKPNANGTAFTVDNTDMTTFPDWQTDERVVAYAALPDDQCVSTGNQWKNFRLELDYKRTDVKPTHVIIVFAASRYGDYFTGSTSSKLYLDDLEFEY